jgi:sulfopyruvate decarboxylase subunit alpha
LCRALSTPQEFASFFAAENREWAALFADVRVGSEIAFPVPGYTGKCYSACTAGQIRHARHAMQQGASSDIREPGNVLLGSSIIAEIKASRIEFVVSVPDITTSEGLLRPLSQVTTPRLIRVCKEDEGVGICAGLSYTDRRALLLIQQTGLLDSINAVRGVAVEYALPICMMVGLLEKEPGVPPRQSKRYGVRIVEPILDVMGIAYHEIEDEADVLKIRPAIEDAYAQSRPVVLLICTRPV